MAQVQVRVPGKVLGLNGCATHFKLPTLNLHLTNVLPLCALCIRRLRHVHAIKQVVDVTDKVVELTIEASTKQRVVDTEVPFLLVVTSNTITYTQLQVFYP